MDSNEFIQVLKTAVIHNVEMDIIKIYTHPPKRKKISAKEQDIADWYDQLSEKEKSYVLNLIREGAVSAVFGFLCVLDGVRAIEDGGEKGNLKLYYEKNGENIFLNDQNKESLHDIFRNGENADAVL